MATEKEILDDLKGVSTQISALVRSVGLSIIAFVWLLVVGGKDSPVLPKTLDRNSLVIAGLLALLAMGADYVQYLAGYLSSKRAHESGVGDVYSYKKTWLSYRLRKWFFAIKQVLLIGGFLLLVYTIVQALV